jgi:ribosomal protein S12 methylthiotransferase
MRSRDLPVFPLTPEPVRPGVSPLVEAVDGGLQAAGPEDGPSIALVTLGCDKNTVDSERMMASLVGHGARVSSQVDGAEVIIVNTCGFIEAAKEQSVETILEACERKNDGDVKAVVAVGCMVQRYKEELQEEIPEVDLFMGLTELEGLIPELQARDLLPPLERIPTMEQPLRVLSTEARHSSFLKISEGCDHTCAFCAIPLMRGLHRSQPLDSLVDEARALGDAGVREVNIISQDTTWWGRDLRRRDRSAPLLPDLLRALL